MIVPVQVSDDAGGRGRGGGSFFANPFRRQWKEFRFILGDGHTDICLCNRILGEGANEDYGD